MTNPPASALRLFAEDAPAPQPGLDVSQLDGLARAFEQATGWQLHHELSPAVPGESWSAAIDDGHGGSDGRLVLSRSGVAKEKAASISPLELQRVRPLALSIAGLLGEMNRLRRAVWQREAELAAGVPIATPAAGEPHFAERLESVLKGGAEAVDCQAAGLYLLDENTSELKLRAAFNLPPDRLLMAARPLRGAVADLEALVGHAVVLEDTSLLPHWRCPEDFPAAVCVPVSSSSAPLGTLWVFSDKQRDFSAPETNLIEIVAGRLAADLEREMLLAAGVELKGRHQDFERAARWLSDRLPSVAPLLEEYEVAGWTRGANGPAASFHDWTVLPDGRLAVAVGDAGMSGSLSSALDLASLHAALKSHAAYPHGAAELLNSVNETLWSASPGDQRAGLAYALLEPETGHIDLAAAGRTAAIAVEPERHRVLVADGPLLGESPDVRFGRQALALVKGEVVLLANAGVRAATDPAGLRLGEATLAACLQQNYRETADGLVLRLRRLLDREGAGYLSLIVLKRRCDRN